MTTIKCAVYANPLANITWFKDGRAILDGVNSTHNVSTLTLAPKTVNDFGLYSCNATNSKGTAWYHITMEQLRKCLSIYTFLLSNVINDRMEGSFNIN